MSKPRNVEQLTAMFKALGNPHRLAIFERLCRCCAPGTVCDLGSDACRSVGELGAELDVAPSTLSHHLKTLAQAGLVRTRREGRQVLCWVDPGVLQDLADFFGAPLAPPLHPSGPTCRVGPGDP